MAAKQLAPKQQRFVQEYLVDLNAAAAARRAGYSERTAASIGQENLTKPEIQKALALAQQARSQRTEITQDYVLRGLKAEAETQDKASSPTARVRALELLGKHLGLFTRDPLHVDLTTGGQPLDRNSLTPADVAAATALLGMACAGVPADSGPQPVDPAHPTSTAETVPAPGGRP